MKCTFFQVLYKWFIPITNNERKEVPCRSYRPTAEELLLLLLFLVVDRKSMETSETILSLEIVKEIFSSLCEMTANIAHIWK